jgi:hypothetical protein
MSKVVFIVLIFLCNICTGSHVAHNVVSLCHPESVCAEVGVWKGEFTREIVQRQPKELYLIDPWAFQKTEFPNRWFSGKIAKSQEDMDKIHASIAETFGVMPNVHILRNKSVDAFKMIKDDTFDWVYIDGNHEEEPTLQDLRDSYRTTKKGGYITGDDYSWQNDTGSHCVKMAVARFVHEYHLPPPEIHHQGGWQFVIQKP